MGVRINVAKNSKNPERLCHCGNPLPCRKHSGSDGDTADYYNPDIDQDDPGAGETMPRHERN